MPEIDRFTREVRRFRLSISLGAATNQTLMNQMAVDTGGRHYFAPTAADLDAVFQQIAAQIPISLVE